MRVLLSDGAGLTARQCATVLSKAGHNVEVLSPDPLCLCRFTGRVRKVHSVPAIGTDPLGWLDAALDVAARRRADMLLPVQEQVAVMALARARITGAGLLTAVPDFAALAQVQDKVSAFRTLTRLGLPQPPATVVTSAAELLATAGPPLYAKAPIGTASAGVRHVSTPAEVSQLAASWDWDTTSMLIQQPVRGPLAMIQSVFAHGELVAFHACVRVGEGIGGGASHKLGIALPAARESITTLGAALGWHGALSADVIVTDRGPLLIDINPRLVEPVNALRSGVDLTAAMIQIARCGSAPLQPASTPGARTHQLLLAVLGAAQQGGTRRDVVRTLRHALTRTADYRDSTEELAPAWSLPVIAATLATVVSPAAWRHFAAAPRAYSLTPAAWQELLDENSRDPQTKKHATTASQSGEAH
jgi:glutathione synthase/RimK-type ligase-like ATP-grasp enzyme